MANLSGGGTGLPVYYTGKRLRNCTVLPLTQNTDGTFAKGTSGDLCTSAVHEYVRFMSETASEEISPSNNQVENEVILKNRFTVELGEIKLADAGANISLPAYGSYDYFLVTAMSSPDGGTTKNYVQAICSRGSIGDVYDGPGKSIIGTMLRCAGQNIAVSVGTPTWT